MSDNPTDKQKFELILECFCNVFLKHRSGMFLLKLMRVIPTDHKKLLRMTELGLGLIGMVKG